MAQAAINNFYSIAAKQNLKGIFKFSTVIALPNSRINTIII